MSRLMVIRADADARMGTGHVMRCLALAQAWQEQGGEVLYVGRIDSLSLQERLRAEGCRYVEIMRPYPAPDDIELMLALLKEWQKSSDGQWVVVDGYHFTDAYTRCLQDAGAKLLVLDDHDHQEQYHADLLLNQNMGSEALAYHVNPNATLLMGSKYVLLRHEFLKGKRCNSGEVAVVADRVLVTLGGADPENVSLKIIDVLDQLDLPLLDVKIIIGPVNPNRDLLDQRMRDVSFKGELLSDVKDMILLMKWADLAVTAAGSTSWELAYLGVPFLTVIVAENQQEIAEQLHEHDMSINLGWSHLLDAKKMIDCFASIITDKNERMKLSANSKRFIDGRGVRRVLKQMEAIA